MKNLRILLFCTFLCLSLAVSYNEPIYGDGPIGGLREAPKPLKPHRNAPKNDNKPLKRFEGPWVTNKGRQLNGVMTCDILSYNEEKQEYTALWYGVWQGVSFKYKTTFSGPFNKLSGQATIDGPDYDWKGYFKKEKGKPVIMHGDFTSSRYSGYFDLTEKKGK